MQLLRTLLPGELEWHLLETGLAQLLAFRAEPVAVPSCMVSFNSPRHLHHRAGGPSSSRGLWWEHEAAVVSELGMGRVHVDSTERPVRGAVA